MLEALTLPQALGHRQRFPVCLDLRDQLKLPLSRTIACLVAAALATVDFLHSLLEPADFRIAFETTVHGHPRVGHFEEWAGHPSIGYSTKEAAYSSPFAQLLYNGLAAIIPTRSAIDSGAQVKTPRTGSLAAAGPTDHSAAAAEDRA